MATYDPARKTSYDPLPNGRYTCRVEDVREKVSDRGVKWTIWFRVIDGEHEKRIVFDDIFFYGKGLEHAASLLKALGRDPDNKQDVLRKDLLDLVCRIGVETRQFDLNGETRTKNIVVSYDFSPDDSVERS